MTDAIEEPEESDDGVALLSLTLVGSTTESTTTKIAYAYSSSVWGDLLISYDGSSITYDKAGNPVSYYNGYKFSWEQGRQLSKVYTSAKTLATYRYNTDGIRIGKTVGNTETEYFVDSTGTIQGLTQGTEKLLFFYDSIGRREGFSYYVNDSLQGNYYYLYNIQGDVEAIVDSSFNVVVSYEYDSWGKSPGTTGDLADTIGALNPFRYRGYVYDEETGLYYLNSRYYDPETGRFINADSASLVTITPTAVSDKNLFAYCDNNPVMRVDTGGNLWTEIETFFTGVWESIEKWVYNTYGFGSTTTATILITETLITPELSPIAIKTGAKTSRIVSEHGNTVKPISTYINRELMKPIKSSSLGIKINISKFTLELKGAMDNLGIYSSITNENITNCFGIRGNRSEYKIGVEWSSTVRWGNRNETTYTNVSINGWFVVAVCCFVATGQTMLLPAYAR